MQHFVGSLYADLHRQCQSQGVDPSLIPPPHLVNAFPVREVDSIEHDPQSFFSPLSELTSSKNWFCPYGVVSWLHDPECIALCALMAEGGDLDVAWCNILCRSLAAEAEAQPARITVFCRFPTAIDAAIAGMRSVTRRHTAVFQDLGWNPIVPYEEWVGNEKLDGPASPTMPFSGRLYRVQGLEVRQGPLMLRFLGDEQLVDFSQTLLEGYAPDFLTPKCPPSYSSHLQLRRLELSGTRMTGPISLEALPPLLEHLDLSCNTFYGEVDLSSISSPVLRTLNLSGNQFTGHLALDQLPPRLRTLNVECNQFTSIPEQLPQGVRGSRPQVDVYLAGNNALIGKIPRGYSPIIILH